MNWERAEEFLKWNQWLTAMVRLFCGTAVRGSILYAPPNLSLTLATVAAAGIPHARQDHAVAMAKFAIDCMNGLHRLAHELEIIYGPDTAELDLRIGLHSGAVTGGFLKGKGARFQVG